MGNKGSVLAQPRINPIHECALCHSWMAYASPEYAKIPYIREWHMPFVNGKALIREWDNSWVGQNTCLLLEILW